MAEFMFEPFEMPADCDEKKNDESFGIFRDGMLFVLVEPLFIMVTDNGFGDSERAGDTGPIEFK